MKDYSHPALEDVSLEMMMQALADPCRLSIVRTLLAAEGKEMACNEIPLKVVKATRSHHFAVLREAGLAFTRCDGTKCMTSIREKEINRRFPGLLDLVIATQKPGKRSRGPRQTMTLSLGTTRSPRFLA